MGCNSEKRGLILIIIMMMIMIMMTMMMRMRRMTTIYDVKKKDTSRGYDDNVDRAGYCTK